MPQSATTIDYLDPDPAKNKTDLKSDIQDFIALPEARKIDIIKIGASGYRAVLVSDNPPLSQNSDV
ncbi:hypothetical protein [uncultured Bradyrhizobium sp.]|jgi:hypothetical protein|uniref:hypothetical protein n=1 Tax=uncultured Bradyrhizobium sp. TaxID=199684 RepID=UPI002622FE7D|nr:hypothetical protein [uncultured Bradyrhizobium sp.]